MKGLERCCELVFPQRTPWIHRRPGSQGQAKDGSRRQPEAQTGRWHRQRRPFLLCSRRTERANASVPSFLISQCPTSPRIARIAAFQPSWFSKTSPQESFHKCFYSGVLMQGPSPPGEAWARTLFPDKVRKDGGVGGQPVGA
ncbi:hypothetical protein M569_15483 [Genlisea aurea]|uniref:Uncharacterized protein n=1 Tax=Genlisea aurea TaxID=192259 RepID=S8BXI0_9LAMI|nr:hypothetical protein M569_15483 [Genlisea aurea]